MKIDISKVTIGERFRKDFGDLQPLADSIAKVGLLQPVGVIPKGPDGHVELVYGERRLRACRDVLGLAEIEIRPLDIGHMLEQERDENEVRKDFTVSERTAIAQAIEAEIGNRQGQRTDKGLGQKIAEVRGRTSEIAAQKAGFGNRETYRQAKKITETATDELVEAMDNNVVSINMAHKLAARPPQEQREAVSDPLELERIQAEAAAEMRRGKSDMDHVQMIVNAFKVLGDSPLSAGKLSAIILPAHAEDIQAAIPAARNFIAAIDGESNAKIKGHLKTV